LADKTKEELIEEIRLLQKRIAELGTLDSERKQQQQQIRRLATVVHDSNDAITIQDFAGNIIAWNRGAKLMYGYSEEEALQMNIEHLTPPDKAAEQKEFTRRLIAGEAVTSFETQRKTKDGRILDVWLAVTKVVDEAGEPVGVASTERDITARKKVADRLRQEKEKAQRYLDIAGVTLLIIDANEQVSMINQKGCEILGYAKEEIIDKNWFDNFLPEGSKEEVKSVFYRTLRGEQGLFSYYEYPVLAKNKEERLIAWNNIIIKNEKGQIISILSSGEDITERKKSETELQKAYDDLKAAQGQLMQAEKMESVGRLASGVVHEVRNPLAIILQGMDYLEKNIKTKDKNFPLVVEEIKQAVSRADSIINGLLNFASISELKSKIEDINSVLEKALSLVKNTLLQYNIQVKQQLAQGIPKVEIDANKIEQVFLNLMLNAVQAMPDGGILTIKTSAKAITEMDKEELDVFRPGETAVVVEIEDTGTGMPQEVLGRVFEPFFTTHRNEKGTGLGLSIVKNIIDLHRGKIYIRNKEESRGARVTVMLPVKEK